MISKTGIVWFRLDLRLHDNEALTEALKCCDIVIPVYVLDPRVFKDMTRWFGFPKTGKFRAKFILESIVDLRSSLRARGSDLIVRTGRPEEEVFHLARTYRSSWVFCNRERTQEEVEVQDELESKLWSIGQEIRYSRGKLLYYTADLPFPISQTPKVFSQFRKEVERVVAVRDPLPSPQRLPTLPAGIEAGKIPSLEEMGHQPFEPDPRAVLHFKGGESEGLKRLRYYLWESGRMSSYCETKDQLLGGDYSTKFSPWLAQGCLSPKMIFQELKRYEQQQSESKSAYAIFLALLWRDFYRLMAKKFGNKIFLHEQVSRHANHPLQNNLELFQKWMNGQTGVRFIDANMRELKFTGYLSARGRQNVANYLVNELNVNWQIGAEYFESMLIDYDVASNWGNWNFIAQSGSDHPDGRYLNPVSQARRYDPNGEYIKTWMPELQHLSADELHQSVAAV